MPGVADAPENSTGADETREPIRCRYCARRFATDRLRSLHHGRAHTEAVSDEEWAAVLAACESEADELRRLRSRISG
jgi:hypothetical protein